MSTKRVYHPETNEPFDLPVGRANKLVLQDGWNQTPVDAKAEPAVKTSPRPRVVADRDAEPASTRGRRWRKPADDAPDDGTQEDAG